MRAENVPQVTVSVLGKGRERDGDAMTLNVVDVSIGKNGLYLEIPDSSAKISWFGDRQISIS